MFLEIRVGQATMTMAEVILAAEILVAATEAVRIRVIEFKI